MAETKQIQVMLAIAVSGAIVGVGTINGARSEELPGPTTGTLGKAQQELQRLGEEAAQHARTAEQAAQKAEGLANKLSGGGEKEARQTAHDARQKADAAKSKADETQRQAAQGGGTDTLEHAQETVREAKQLGTEADRDADTVGASSRTPGRTAPARDGTTGTSREFGR